MERPYKLVYISRPVSGLTAEELYDIIKVSNINNAKVGVTGILLYKGGMFFQVLEGDKDAVTHVYYDVIVNDTRHCDPSIIIEGYDNKRNFPNWHMHPNTFDHDGFIKPEELQNDSDLKILEIVDKFDKANY